MNLWYVTSRAATHNGTGHCHVIAYLSMEVNRVLDAHGWGRTASQISIRRVRDDLELERKRALYEGALNWEDWRSELSPSVSALPKREGR